MNDYKVLSRVNHNNQNFEPGETISLDDKTAKHLLEYGVVEPMPQQEIADQNKPSSGESGETTGGDEGNSGVDVGTTEAESETIGVETETVNADQPETEAQPTAKTRKSK